MYNEKQIEKIIGKCTSEKQVIKALDDNGIRYTKDEYSEYLNIYIRIGERRYLRIYKPYNGKYYIMQRMEKVVFEYSGISVFMPGGKDTL